MSKDIILNSFDRVAVISQDWKERYDLPLSYVGNADDKKQMWTGLNWAGDSEENPADVRYFNNDNFTLEIKYCPNDSSQGGKLSFWICKITTEDGFSFYTSINSFLLQYLLRECDFIKGVCQEKVIFVRNKSQIGVISKNGELYQQLLSDTYMRQNPKAKTNEYKPGDIVETLREKYTYVGYIYEYFSWKKDWKYYNGCCHYVYTVRIYKEPIKKHLFLTKLWYEEKEVCYGIYISPLFTGEAEDKPKYFIMGHRDIKTIDEYIKEEFAKEFYKIHYDNKWAEKFYRLNFRENPNEEIDIEEIKKSIEEYHNYYYDNTNYEKFDKVVVIDEREKK